MSIRFWRWHIISEITFFLVQRLRGTLSAGPNWLRLCHCSLKTGTDAVLKCSFNLLFITFYCYYVVNSEDQALDKVQAASSLKHKYFKPRKLMSFFVLKFIFCKILCMYITLLVTCICCGFL